MTNTNEGLSDAKKNISSRTYAVAIAVGPKSDVCSPFQSTLDSRLSGIMVGMEITINRIPGEDKFY
jgi:hypothetical protein